MANKVKKTYVAPDLYYENFEMSEHVATCAWDMSNLHKKDTCTAESDKDYTGLSGINLFTLANDACDASYEKSDDKIYVENYCWTNGSGNSNVFNS